MEDTIKAHAQLWNLTFSFIKSMCLKCAIELAIPDAIHLHGTPATVSDLCASLSVPPVKSRHLRSLMRLLSLEGLFDTHVTPSGEEAFDLTPISRFLLSTSIHCSSPFVRFILDCHLVDSSQMLGDWLRSPDVTTSSFEITHGKVFWDLVVERPQLNRLFNSAMESDSSFVIDIVTRVCWEAFRGIGSLVDVGGGTGLTAVKLVEAFTGLRCIVFDLPHVISTAPRASAAIEFVSGDMFVEVPRADAALLKWILHDWNDEECIKILKRCKEAIPPREKGGKLIIIDMVAGMGVNDAQITKETQLLFELHMMINTTGKERDEEEWHNLFVAAGLCDYKIIHSIGLRSVIEVYP
ncbi:hypothetical protein HPP92_023856 [Vanilla planifolia]|uniref:Uncharacterized protein n=1 Tax=Vanilla planifolia TaxID=51239 RepID=A0A835PJU4_VANPL|nr:hypothetical protein HPP92_023856 [Vanilla planifolia]